MYHYNDLAQVISGRRFWDDGTLVTLVAGQRFEYAFDDIGSRAGAGGRASDESACTVNEMNQHETWTVPNAVDVCDGARSANAPPPTSPGGQRSRGALTSCPHPSVRPNNQQPQSKGSTGGLLFLPGAHDTDGNLHQGDRWDCVWDGENRLIAMRSRINSLAPERRIAFEYDWQGRRIRKTLFNYHNGWFVQSCRRILVRQEKRLRLYQAFTLLACFMIILKRVPPLAF